MDKTFSLASAMIFVVLSIACSVCSAQDSAMTVQADTMDLAYDIVKIRAWAGYFEKQTTGLREVRSKIERADTILMGKKSLQDKDANKDTQCYDYSTALDCLKDMDTNYSGQVDAEILFRLQRVYVCLVEINGIKMKGALDPLIVDLGKLAKDIDKAIKRQEERTEGVYGMLARLESPKKHLGMLGLNLTSAVAQQEINELSSEWYGFATPIKLGANISAHPGGGEEADFLTPSFW